MRASLAIATAASLALNALLPGAHRWRRDEAHRATRLRKIEPVTRSSAPTPPPPSSQPHYADAGAFIAELRRAGYRQNLVHAAAYVFIHERFEARRWALENSGSLPPFWIGSHRPRNAELEAAKAFRLGNSDSSANATTGSSRPD